MTLQEARAYNRAISDAVNAYKHGVGAIRALRLREVVTVEHVGTTTTQEVKEVE